MDINGYKLGQTLAYKTAGIMGNLGELAKDVGSAGMNILKSKNPWVTNALYGAGAGASINAVMAPEGHRMNAAMKGIVPGAVGGALWHGMDKGVGRIVGSPEVPMGAANGVMAKPGISKSLKALSGLDPELTRGNAAKSLARRAAPFLAATAVTPHVYEALGLNGNTPQYEDQGGGGQGYLQGGPFLAR
jgi:hypothetical protein